ncbi:FtsB family cell division protein [Palleronia sp. KMU-117]|uniref:FtsB family cell division protein n=1 Tax=Palleronia sp. KMU-117 TaxID=3434108 RepID=UPI003D7357D8
MSGSRRRAPLGALIYLSVMASLGMYFTYASVQGDYGLFRRVQIDAEARTLAEERDRLRAEAEALGNKTRRLSDQYLDLDLLDEQSRNVLGLVRSDEVVLR